MPNVSVTTALYTGFTGAPGYMKLHWEELTTPTARDAAGGAHRLMCSNLSGYMMTTWGWAVQSLIQTFDVATGKLTGESSMTTAPTAVSGTQPATNVYAGGTGGVVNWLTGAVINGRKVRGRSFLVPLMSNAFSADGTLTSGCVTSLTAAGNAALGTTGCNMTVWSKIWDKKPVSPPDPVPPKQIGGSLARVTSVLVPDRAAQLRSRRS